MWSEREKPSLASCDSAVTTCPWQRAGSCDVHTEPRPRAGAKKAGGREHSCSQREGMFKQFQVVSALF